MKHNSQMIAAVKTTFEEACGKEVGKSLNPEERLQIAEKLFCLQSTKKQVSLPVTGQQKRSLERLFGVAFDTIDFDVIRTPENHQYEIEVSFKREQRCFRKGIGFSVASDGALLAVAEINITKPPSSIGSLVGLEGIAYVTHVEEDPIATQHPTSPLSERADDILRIAGSAIARTISMN